MFENSQGYQYDRIIGRLNLTTRSVCFNSNLKGRTRFPRASVWIAPVSYLTLIRPKSGTRVGGNVPFGVNWPAPSLVIWRSSLAGWSASMAPVNHDRGVTFARSRQEAECLRRKVRRHLSSESGEIEPGQPPNASPPAASRPLPSSLEEVQSMTPADFHRTGRRGLQNGDVAQAASRSCPGQRCSLRRDRPAGRSG